MLSSPRQRLLVIIFIILVVSIPTGSLLLSQRLKVGTNNTTNFDRNIANSGTEIPKTPPIQIQSSPSPSPTPSTQTATDTSSTDVSLGPALKFSVTLEGRGTNDEGGKFFVGIADGGVVTNPTYLLTFTITVPSTGVYSNLSLVGLTIGSQYTAYIKGPSQLVKASTFTLTPTGATLNDGQPLSLTSGDLNQDNVVDASDLGIVNTLAGATPDAANWNPLADINDDGIVNSLDIAIVKNNQGKIGDGGPWYSRAPVASTSASLPSNIGGLEQPNLSFPTDLLQPPANLPKGGYWIYVPPQP